MRCRSTSSVSTSPDLVHRFAVGAPLAEFDPDLLYTHGVEGYADYPPLGAAPASRSVGEHDGRAATGATPPKMSLPSGQG
jgi:hypothetical protein